jgi:hypothetical protein
MYLAELGMRQSRFILIAALVVVFVALQSSAGMADTQIFRSRQDWDVRLITSESYSFEESDGFPGVGTVITSLGNGRILTSAVGGNVQIVDLLAHHRHGHALGVSGTPITLQFNDNPFAIGFEVLSTQTEVAAPNALITIRHFDETFDEIYRLLDSGGPVSSDVFFGIISSERITSIEIDGFSESLGFVGANGDAVDNLTVGIVPEPLGISMFLVISSWVALLRRRGL